MKITVLIDNIPSGCLAGEWGLSFHIEYMGRRYLLDAGTTGAFADNAERLGIDLRDVDVAVLSHTHYDHADGFERFFAVNDRAPLYVRAGSAENCYGTSAETGEQRYIGIRRGLLDAHAERIRFAGAREEIAPGVHLLSHDTPGLERIAARSGLFVLKDGALRNDDFAHEQSLVFETKAGLVAFNSCSHAGADNILRELRRAFPGTPVRALLGGLHLYRLSDDEVRAFARRVREEGISRLVTGHCTGERAFEILREELGDAAAQMCSGYTVEL